MQSEYDLKQTKGTLLKWEREEIFTKNQRITHIYSLKKKPVKLQKHYLQFIAKDDTTFASAIFPGICNASEYSSKKRVDGDE